MKSQNQTHYGRIASNLDIATALAAFHPMRLLSSYPRL
jgi:hypothetical protein